MERTCIKCGFALGENDFICPQCGEICGEHAEEPPKQETVPAKTQRKRSKMRLLILRSAIVLLAVLICIVVLEPFQPGETTGPTYATEPTSKLPQPTESTPPRLPTFDPAALAAQVPETVQAEMKTAFLQGDSKLQDRDVSAVRIDRVFGIFDGAYVLFVDLDDYYSQKATTVEIGELEFRYTDGQVMLVYFEQQFYRLHEAFSMQIITLEQLECVYENYYNAYPHIEKPYVEPEYQDPLAVHIPQELQLKMKQAFADAYGHGYFAAEDVYLEYISILKGRYVFIADGWDNGEASEQVICGYTFDLQRGWVYVYTDGQIYSLLEAFNTQLISLEELETLHDTYYAMRLHLEQPEVDELHPMLMSQIPAEEQLQIRQDYIYQKTSPYQQVQVKDVYLTIYGVHEDVYVLEPWLSGYGSDSSLVAETVNELTFFYESHCPVYVYWGGDFYSLTEAFEMGLLDAEALQLTFENYYHCNEAWSPEGNPELWEYFRKNPEKFR